MSVMLLSDKHISALVKFWAANCTLTKPTPREIQAVGEALKLQNIKSVASQYPQFETPLIDSPHFYHYERDNVSRSAIAIVKLVLSWQYQSCEDENHQTSLGWLYSESILDEAIRQIPGYEQAEWCI